MKINTICCPVTDQHILTKHSFRVLFCLVILINFVALSAQPAPAATKVLSMQLGTADADCSCTDPGLFCTSWVQSGFIPNEICASRFNPDPADYPLQIRKIYAIFGTSGTGPGTFDLTIWEDSGTSVNPGSIIFYQDGYAFMGDDSACQLFDLTTGPVVCLSDTSKDFRVGFTYGHSGEPGNYRDNGIHFPNQSYIFASGMWWYANILGVMGDWIMEVEIDTNSPLCGGVSPTPTFPGPTSTPTSTPPPTATPTPGTPTDTPVPTSTYTPSPTGTSPASRIYFDRSDYYTESDSAIITVEDHKLNTDPGSKQSATISIQSTTDIIGFSMTVVETGDNTGVFATSSAGVNLTFSMSGSDAVGKTIWVSDGDTVSSSYFDSIHTVTRTDTAYWHEFAPTPTPTPPPSYVMFNRDDYCTTSDEAVIMLYDPDLNTNPGTQQSVIVHVISNSDLTGIDLTLTEETIDSPVFTSSATGINLTFSTSGSVEPLGIIKVANGNIIRVSYTDTSPPATRNDTAHWWDSMAPCSVTATPPLIHASGRTSKSLILVLAGVMFLLFRWSRISLKSL